MWIRKKKLEQKIWDAKIEVAEKFDNERREIEQWDRINRLEERVRNLEIRNGNPTTGTGVYVETPF